MLKLNALLQFMTYQISTQELLRIIIITLHVCAGNIQLVDGGSIYEGRIQVLIDGEWGTLCDRSFDFSDAQVACRQLGFPGAVEVVNQVLIFSCK